ncbi:class I adenylate-forming enzyme family protein [Cerasicoccus maritimus]|uniref:class I adenylate-forming enzyme family protein n=1 Tax=Cerasicoccus maritimus TaxID=490089 RepID=UPI0028525C98|nr:class I adenylate-forming enzyme family protein [Cerasicoccus maritimus]
MQQLADILAQGQSQWPNKVAVADASRSLTYGELALGAQCIAGWLIAQGVAPGDRVAIRLPNSVRFVETFFGVQWAGAVTTPLDPAMPEAQFRAIVKRAEPKVVLDAQSPWEDIFSAAPLGEAVNRAPDDLASLMFTTGTTGQPKGVMLTQANVLTALQNITEFVGYTPADREVITLPLSHNFGLGHMLCNLLCGGAVYLEPGMSRVGRVLKAIESFGATGFPTTPLGVSLLLDRYREVFVERAQGLRFMVVNSAPLPPERAAELQAALPDLNVLVYYGLTEASRSTYISLTEAGPDRYGSVGQPMNAVDLKIADTGEVLIGGPTVTPGYWCDDELTQATLPNGVLHTGDLGHLDGDGYLYITGRADDIINLGGYKINPLQVERVLEQFTGVAEAAVVGKGEVCAYYVATEELDADVLTKHCRTQLQVYETPQRYIRIDALPRTDSGKLKRQELRQAGD